MIQILTVIAPIFIIIFASALLQKFKNIGDDWSRVLNSFTLNVGLPVLIFSAFSKAPVLFSEQAQLIIANSLFILASFLLAIIIGKILRLEKQMFRTLFICFAFSNVVYFGIPVLIQVSGDAILQTASLIAAVYLFLFFTVGTGYLDYLMKKGKKDVAKNTIKNLSKNPLLFSVVLGIIVGNFEIILPPVLMKSLDMISVSVIPIALIVIGLFIGKSETGRLTEWFPILLFSILTLVFLPALFYFGTKIFGFIPSQFSSSIIQAAMPLAITPFALADKYDLDKVFITRSVVLSTALSVISLQFWISFLAV